MWHAVRMLGQTVLTQRSWLLFGCWGSNETTKDHIDPPPKKKKEKKKSLLQDVQCRAERYADNNVRDRTPVPYTRCSTSWNGTVWNNAGSKNRFQMLYLINDELGDISFTDFCQNTNPRTRAAQRLHQGAHQPSCFVQFLLPPHRKRLEASSSYKHLSSFSPVIPERAWRQPP